MSGPHRPCVPVVVAVILAGSLLPLEAATGPAVRVRIDVQSPHLSQQWGPALGSVVLDVQRAFADSLKDRLPHWDFDGSEMSAPSPGAEIALQITETVSGSLSFLLQLRRPNLAVPPQLTENWLASADIMMRGYPQSSSAASEISTALKARIVTKHEIDLRRWLSENVPIAIGAHWLGQDTPPRLVLALPWSRYDALRQSVFLLLCDWPSRGTATVESIGPGLAAPYTPPPPDLAPNPPFDGVLVIAREREYAGQRRPVDQLGAEVFELHPKLVFLKEYVPASDWNVSGGQP